MAVRHVSYSRRHCEQPVESVKRKWLAVERRMSSSNVHREQNRPAWWDSKLTGTLCSLYTVLKSSHINPALKSLHWLIKLFLPHQQPLFPSCITLSLESASQGTSPAYRSRRLITLIWSHTCQFISCITTVTIHYSFSLPLQTQNSSFPQNFSSISSTFPPTGLTPRTLGVFRFSRACWF